MKTTIFSQHEEHTQWINKLNFYKDEIIIMQKRIDEVSSKNTAKEVAVKLTHFQNQLTIQSDNIRTTLHRITRKEKELQHNIEQNPVASDHRKVEDHSEERSIVEGFELNFNNLRKELNEVLSKWM